MFQKPGEMMWGGSLVLQTVNPALVSTTQIHAFVVVVVVVVARMMSILLKSTQRFWKDVLIHLSFFETVTSPSAKPAWQIMHLVRDINILNTEISSQRDYSNKILDGSDRGIKNEIRKSQPCINLFCLAPITAGDLGGLTITVMLPEDQAFFTRVHTETPLNLQTELHSQCCVYTVL